MGERTLRGSRLGATSYETERDTDKAKTNPVVYECPYGHTFTIVFAEGAEAPSKWECPPSECCGKGGTERAMGVYKSGKEPQVKRTRPTRTHWDMLRERRSLEELDQVLNERLEEIRSARS